MHETPPGVDGSTNENLKDAKPVQDRLSDTLKSPSAKIMGRYPLQVQGKALFKLATDARYFTERNGSLVPTKTEKARGLTGLAYDGDRIGRLDNKVFGKYLRVRVLHYLGRQRGGKYEHQHVVWTGYMKVVDYERITGDKVGVAPEVKKAEVKRIVEESKSKRAELGMPDIQRDPAEAELSKRDTGVVDIDRSDLHAKKGHAMAVGLKGWFNNYGLDYLDMYAFHIDQNEPMVIVRNKRNDRNMFSVHCNGSNGKYHFDNESKEYTTKEVRDEILKRIDEQRKDIRFTNEQELEAEREAAMKIAKERAVEAEELRRKAAEKPQVPKQELLDKIKKYSGIKMTGAGFTRQRISTGEYVALAYDLGILDTTGQGNTFFLSIDQSDTSVLKVYSYIPQVEDFRPVRTIHLNNIDRIDQLLEPSLMKRAKEIYISRLGRKKIN